MPKSGTLGLGHNYHGGLAVPIGVEDATEAHVRAEFSRKLDMLFQEFGIAPGDWESLAFTLALHHVPGFQVAYVEQSGPTGRPIIWSEERLDALAALVDRIVAEAKGNLSQGGRRTITGACEHIARSGVDPRFMTPPGGDHKTWAKTLAKQVSAARSRAATSSAESSFTGHDAISKHFAKPQG